MASLLPVSREHLSFLDHETKLVVQMIRELVERVGPIEGLDEPLEKLIFVSNRLDALVHPHTDPSKPKKVSDVIKLHRS